MKIFVAGLSYKTAPVELREQLAVHASRLRCHGCRLKVHGELSEVVLVSTCNRVEIYGVAEKVNGNVHRLFQHFSASNDVDFSSHLYIKEGREAVQQGIDQLAANVLIIEHPHQSLGQMRNMLGQFMRTRRSLSEEVKQQLQELATCG